MQEKVTKSGRKFSARHRRRFIQRLLEGKLAAQPTDEVVKKQEFPAKTQHFHLIRLASLSTFPSRGRLENARFFSVSLFGIPLFFNNIPRP
ncbi:MAG: hypothetical protein ACI4O0_04180 [Candidatus Limivicinus sp.]